VERRKRKEKVGQVIRSLTELFAFAFLLTSTVVLWYAFAVAVLNGDAVTIYTNLSGERNTEILFCIAGVIASVLTIPKVMFRRYLV